MAINHDDLLPFAIDVDRFTRLLHISTRPKAQVIDTARIGPYGAMVLMTIADNEPLPVLELAKHLERDKAQMTRSVQLLERNGLAKRTPSTEDGRVSLIQLTEAGHALALAFRELVAEVLEEKCSGLDTAELEQFSRTLRKILAK